MESTKLDILTVQKDVSVLDKALDNLVNPAVNVLYTNCMSRLKMGGKVFGIEFDTALYSEENDKLILIMRGSGISEESLIEKLNVRGIEYAKVEFSNDTYEDYEDELKDIIFARDGSVLKESLRNSKNKGIDVCRYNPVMRGKFSLKYPGRFFIDEELGEIENIHVLEKLHIRGMVETDDKIILLLNDHDECNVYYKQVLGIISEIGMAPIMEDYESYKQKEKVKVKTKEDE